LGRKVVWGPGGWGLKKRLCVISRKGWEENCGKTGRGWVVGKIGQKGWGHVKRLVRIRSRKG